MASSRLSDDPKWRRSSALHTGQKLVVRLATHSDYTGVIDIDKHRHIYAGHDYVPEIYHEILQEAHAYSFVGVLNGTIVYFTVMHVAEEGRTTVSCAARISESCRGQNIASVARTLVYNIIQENIPTIVRDRWTGVMWDNVLVAADKPVPSFEMLHTWNFLAINFRDDQLKKFLSKQPQTRSPRHVVSKLTSTQARNIISDQQTCRRIFPPVQTIFVGHNWMPHTIPTSHPGHILAHADFFGVHEQGTELVAVGTAHGFPSAYGTEVHVVYYGQPDVRSVKAFAVAVLRDVVKHCACGRPLCFCLSFPIEVDEATIADFFADYVTRRKAAYMAKL